MRKQLGRGQMVRLDGVEQTFAKWRSTRRVRRIPGSLWGAAARLVAVHGLSVSRVSKRLRVNPGDLKRRVLAVRIEEESAAVEPMAARSEGAKFARIELPAVAVAATQLRSGVRLRIEGMDGVMMEAVLPGRTIPSLIRVLEPLLG
ncbi:MAG: hypothetical protein HYX75_04180 [Acidobacteria bacterium]|nr:hypothetical protein [Acidobacteriota bacterium]